MSSDPHPQGGSLTDMAVDGTTVPDDSARPNQIPSKARKGQGEPEGDDGIGATDLALAADNAQDIPRVSHVVAKPFPAFLFLKKTNLPYSKHHQQKY